MRTTAKSLLTLIAVFVIVMPGFRKGMAGQSIQTVHPEPTGRYEVGSRYFYLVDKNRPDLISPDPHDYRAISLQVWYPAESGPDDQIIPLSDRGSRSVIQTKPEITLARAMEDTPDLYKKLNRAMPTEVSDLRLWGEDIGLVIDELKEMNSKTGYFNGVLDVNPIGVMGYSKGGAAAGQYCLTADGRCRAGVNLGGFIFGDIVEANLKKKPFLIMEADPSDEYTTQQRSIEDEVAFTSSGEAYQAELPS